MNTMLENDILVDLFSNTIKEKYSDLSEEDMKEVLEEIKSKF